MNEAARMLMQRIDEASFAMDDVVLYLDTHPTDLNALSYYNYVTELRKEAVDTYEAQFGPLSPQAVQSTENWTWMTETWPWEGEV